MKRCWTTCLWVCMILLALLTNTSAVRAQVSEIPEIPLVKLTGDIDCQPAVQYRTIVYAVPLVRLTGDIDCQVLVQPQTVTYSVPLVRITGDILFDKRQLEWHIAGDIPLVVYTGDVRPGVTVVAVAPRESTQPAFISDENLGSMTLVAAFTESHDASLFADNAELLDMSESVRLLGREAIGDFLQTYYGGSRLFREAHEEPLRLIVQDESTIVCESVFYGIALRRDGSLVRALRDPLTVQVPMVSIFDIKNDQIVSLRLYYDADRLLPPLELR